VHRAIEESGLTESANGSIARRAERAEALGRGLEPPRRPLTNSAFSWKFACRSGYSARKDVPSGVYTLRHSGTTIR
jgi:hypothetical protein